MGQTSYKSKQERDPGRGGIGESGYKESRAGRRKSLALCNRSDLQTPLFFTRAR